MRRTLFVFIIAIILTSGVLGVQAEKPSPLINRSDLLRGMIVKVEAGTKVYKSPCQAKRVLAVIDREVLVAIANDQLLPYSIDEAAIEICGRVPIVPIGACLDLWRGKGWVGQENITSYASIEDYDALINQPLVAPTPTPWFQMFDPSIKRPL